MGLKIIGISILLIGITQTQQQQQEQKPEQKQEDQFVSDRIKDIFGEPPSVNLTGCPQGQECVKLHQCKQEGLIITDGEGLFDVRFGEEDDNSPKQCPSLEICCTLKNTVEVDKPLIIPKPLPPGCGYRNTNGIGYRFEVIPELQTQYGEFPWMIAIIKEEINGNQIFSLYQCGGALIHPSVVLTAAHCVESKDPKLLKIRAGEWDTQTKAELYPDQERAIAEIVVHGKYYRGALFNDIALLILDKPVDVINNIKPICLPPADTNFDLSRCYATGWGKDTFGQIGKYQVILKKVDLPIVPRDICQAKLRKTRLGKHFELHESFICAGGEEGKDTCKGDGGSPLVCPIPGSDERYYQAGIVAYGVGCGDRDIPGVYASVAKLRPWIDEQLAIRKLDSEPFTP